MNLIAECHFRLADLEVACSIGDDSIEDVVLIVPQDEIREQALIHQCQVINMFSSEYKNPSLPKNSLKTTAVVSCATLIDQQHINTERIWYMDFRHLYCTFVFN
ncbi:unnamed protein product [Caenorhabditis nigoni]